MAVRASRPWRRAAAGALAVHAVLFALAVRSVKITAPPPEPSAMGVQLVRLEPPQPRRITRPRPASRPASPIRSSAVPSSAVPALPSPASARPAAPPALASPSDGDAAGRVRAMLRGSAGCESADLLDLSDSERRKCAAWRRTGVDPGLRIAAPMDPVKKGWFDASLEARRRAQAPPFGHPPPKLITGSCGGAPSAPDSVKVGPCRVGIPGLFNDDDVPPP